MCAPNGAAYNLMSPGSDAVRASYRDLGKGRQLLTPDRVYEIPLNHLVTSNRLSARSPRADPDLRHVLSELLAQSPHRRSRDGLGAQATGDHPCHHDRAHPSQVSLHVVDR